MDFPIPFLSSSHTSVQPLPPLSHDADSRCSLKRFSTSVKSESLSRLDSLFVPNSFNSFASHCMLDCGHRQYLRRERSHIGLRELAHTQTLKKKKSKKVKHWQTKKLYMAWIKLYEKLNNKHNIFDYFTLVSSGAVTDRLFNLCLS